MALLPIGQPRFGVGLAKGQLSCLLPAANKLSAHLTRFTLPCWSRTSTGLQPTPQYLV